MPDFVEVKVSGVDDLGKTLDALDADLRKRVVIGALRDAARPIVVAARANAPVLKAELRSVAGRKKRIRATSNRIAGTLRRNINAFASKIYKGQRGVIGIYVTVRASRRDLKNAPVTGDPYYFRWVEAGHRIVARFKGKYTDFKVRGRGRQTGLALRRAASTERVKPYPFLGPAFQAKGATAIQIFEDRIVERIAKANQAK